MSEQHEHEVIVVGGGAIGSATAWALARRGVRAVLLERFEPGHGRGASHGGGRIFRLVHPDPMHVRLAQYAQQWWDLLETESGTSLITLNGCVDHGPVRVLRALAESLMECDVDFEYLREPEAITRWPGMRFDDRVIVQRIAGRVDADRAVDVLQSEAVRHGADVRHHMRVVGVEPDGDGVNVHVVASGGPDDGVRLTLRAHVVVVTVGAWSQSLLADVPGVELPSMLVTRGQPAFFPVRDGVLGDGDGWPSFIHHADPVAHAEARGDFGVDAGYPAIGGYGHHVPGAGVTVGQHVPGPVVDPEARDAGADSIGLAGLVDYVRTWFPGLDAEVPVPVPCTSETTPDGRLIVDRVGQVVIGAGFSGHGFTFTPGIGQVLADLATGEQPSVPGVDLSEFGLARFAVPQGVGAGG